MEIFEPLIIMSGISFLLFGLSYFVRTIYRLNDYDDVVNENRELRKENSLLRSIKGVVEK